MNKGRNWFGIILGAVWFVSSLLILIMYLTGSIDSSFPVPRLLLFVYDALGIVPGAIVQMVLSGLLFVFSVKGKN